MSPSSAELDFRAVDEPRPGARWAELFAEFWPAYQRWYRRGSAPRPSYLECRRALRTHLPELEPLWERLTELAGGGDEEARFLSLYRPTPCLVGCAQAVWRAGDEVALLRNYDYSPGLCDGVILRSQWTGEAVLATTDCLIGALDGINAAGLAGALAFGGRSGAGDGFGAPLVLRYLLETCRDVQDATAALQSTPVHMAYTFALADRSGRSAMAYLGPDRPSRVEPRRAATNHQGEVEWPRYAEFTSTVERLEALEQALAAPGASLESVAGRLQRPPLHRREYARGSGTLYTAVLRPDLGTVEYRWPGRSWRLALDGFQEGVLVVHYQPGAGDPV